MKVCHANLLEQQAKALAVHHALGALLFSKKNIYYLHQNTSEHLFSMETL